MRHPARNLTFEDIYALLQRRIEMGSVREVVGEEGLRLYVYTEQCTYDKMWDDISLMARGLILDVDRKEVVATPFPKFFNVYEREQNIPDLSFETFEKMDGSLIIIFFHNGQWKTATKGSFKSDQAKWALEEIQDVKYLLKTGITYLCEAIYPENRIVVHYDYASLVMLAAYDENGTEITYEGLHHISPWPITKRYSYKSVSELLQKATTLPASAEGFVLRFSNGLRLKIKGDEYCRIHRIISRVTPLSMWEAKKNNDNLEEIRKQLPEEFWADFDSIIAILDKRIADIVDKTSKFAEFVSEWSDKEVGLNLEKFPEDVRSFLFPYRRNKGDLLSGKARESVFRSIRPTGNVLEGYKPSSSMNRVMDEV